MKKADYSIRHITIRDGEKEYLVSFRTGIWRGVSVVDLHGFSDKVKVISAYPPLFGVIADMLLHLGVRLKRQGQKGLGERIANLGVHIAKCPCSVNKHAFRN